MELQVQIIYLIYTRLLVCAILTVRIMNNRLSFSFSILFSFYFHFYCSFYLGLGFSVMLWSQLSHISHMMYHTKLYVT